MDTIDIYDITLYATGMRHLFRIGAVGSALATVLLGTPSTASASGTMHVTGGSGCVNAYNHTFQCFDDFAGGTAPYTVTGTTSNSYAHINQISVYAMGDGSQEIWVYGDCDYGKQTWVYLTVRDSAGQVLIWPAQSISCSSGPSGV